MIIEYLQSSKNVDFCNTFTQWQRIQVLSTVETSLRKSIEQLKLNGIKVLGASLEATQPIYKVDMEMPTAIVLGSEGKGISRDVSKLLDDQFLIPQVGTTDSFNVSVAAGITLYEVLRQRQS